MNILAKLFDKLRFGTATPDEIENLDRRLFCLGAAASAGSLIARPTFVDFGIASSTVEPTVKPIPDWLKWTLIAGMGMGAYAAWRSGKLS